MRFLPLLLLGLAGCVSVPSTEVTFNPQTDALRIKSPKNVHIGMASVTKSGTNFTLTVNDYSSTNDNAVVTTVSQAQAAIAKNASDSITALANLAAQAAAKAP